jgi:hypothetical protein
MQAIAELKMQIIAINSLRNRLTKRLKARKQQKIFNKFKDYTMIPEHTYLANLGHLE